MTAPTFTPGPWRRAGHRSIASGVGVSRVTICELYSWGDCSEADANEALIAAAPDLFAAAEAVALCTLLRALDLARGVVLAPGRPAS